MSQPGMKKMLLMIAVMYFSGQIEVDGEAHADRRNMLYAVAGAVYLLQAAIFLYIGNKARNSSDKTRVVVPAQVVMGNAVGEEKVVTVSEYDLSKVKEQFNQLLIGIGIIVFITYKFESHRPLLLNTFYGLFNLPDSPLVKIYILGQAAEGDLKRPFPAPSMFPTMPTPPAEEQQEEQTAPPPAVKGKKEKTILIEEIPDEEEEKKEEEEEEEEKVVEEEEEKEKEESVVQEGVSKRKGKSRRAD